MSKQAFEKIKGGLDEAIVIAPYVAEIERLRAENEKLRAALKPFADAVKDEYNWKYDINVDDFRAAAAALKDKSDG